MPFCTIVEFEFGEALSRAQFEGAIGGVDDEGAPVPPGRLSRIAGVDDNGSRVIEVWQSPSDARAFAEQSAPHLQASELPPPTRVVGFQVTSYVTS